MTELRTYTKDTYSDQIFEPLSPVVQIEKLQRMRSLEAQIGPFMARVELLAAHIENAKELRDKHINAEGPEDDNAERDQQPVVVKQNKGFTLLTTAASLFKRKKSAQELLEEARCAEREVKRTQAKERAVLSINSAPHRVAAALTFLYFNPQDIEYILTSMAEWKSLRDEIMVSNTRLARSIAHKYSRNSAEWDDFTQIGIEALDKAIENYNPQHEIPFHNYAPFWIHQAIRRQLKLHRESLSYSHDVMAYIGKLRKVAPDVNKLSVDEVIIHLGVGKRRAKRVLYAVKQMNTLEIDATHEEGSGEEDGYHDIVKENETIAGIDSFETADIKDMLRKLMKVLTDAERKVVELRYGLTDDIERTLEDVGEILGVTRERVRQIEAKALSKMHARL